MDRRTLLAAVGSGVTAALAGCFAGGEPTGDNAVGMTQVAYRPDDLTVTPGTTVEFQNTSSHSHTVTAYQDAYPDGAEYWASGGFDSEAAARDDWNSSGQDGKLVPGSSYEHTFDVPGVYNYYCVPHEEAGMVGVIRVEQQSGNRS